MVRSVRHARKQASRYHGTQAGSNCGRLQKVSSIHAHDFISLSAAFAMLRKPTGHAGYFWI
jgi:hypothetical protein